MGSIILSDASESQLKESMGAVRKTDFSRPTIFDLREQKPYKTVDIGQDGTLVSADLYGRLLQISIFHPEHGIVVAEPFEQFDGSRFYDVPYVRKHRTRMLQAVQDNQPGFGINFGQNLLSVSVGIPSWNTAVIQFTLPHDLKVNITIQVLDGGELVQRAIVTNIGSARTTLPYWFSLRTSLNRASYGQLTEGGPIPLPESRNLLQIDEKSVHIHNSALEARLVAALEVNGQLEAPVILGDQEISNGPLKSMQEGVLTIEPRANATLLARFKFSSCHANNQTHRDHRERLRPDPLTGWYNEGAITTYILRRNVDYVLANCVIPISQDTAAVITDHVALPLGWNRDNYWQIRLLLEAYKHLSHLVQPRVVTAYADQIKYVTKGHLNWVFHVAQRPYGFWHRSYLVTGKPKDQPIFQLDQQCYPLLEICDYLDYFPDEISFVKDLLESQTTTDVLTLLESKRDPGTGLWPTDETPGDDAVIYPYHFSSHVLLWRTMARLRDVWKQLSPADNEVRRLDQIVADLRDRTLQSFVSKQPESKRTMFAYLTDGRGHQTFYHDANDVPTLFAAEWGFVESSDEISVWKNTMDFGFSTANIEGYCDKEPFNGLGSVHSPGAWVLGYFQELAYGAYLQDRTRIKSTWEKISAAMQWDGTFSEAIDPKTAQCSSKAWFSWPGAMIGALLIRMKYNGIERVLLAEDDRRLDSGNEVARPSL